MHDVYDHVGHEESPVVGGPEHPAFVVGETAATGKMPGLLRVIEAHLGLGDLKQLGRGAVVRDHMPRTRDDQVRVAREVFRAEQHVLDVVGVVRAEHPSPGVEGDPEPARRLVRGRNLARLGPEAKVGAFERHDPLRRARRTGRAAVSAVGAVNPVVEPPGEAVDVVLRVTDRKTGQDDRALVGAPVPVVVSQEQDVGRARHQDASAPGEHRGGILQAVGEYGRLLEVPVGVGVFEQLHAAPG